MGLISEQEVTKDMMGLIEAQRRCYLSRCFSSVIVDSMRHSLYPNLRNIFDLNS